MKHLLDYNSTNNTYFTILGKAISVANEFEHKCIEYAKFNIIENKLTRIPPFTTFNYDEFKKCISKKENKKLFETSKKGNYEKSLNDFINGLPIETDTATFHEARKKRNDIVHYYPQKFFSTANNKKELEKLIISLETDMKEILEAQLMIQLINTLLFGFSLNYLKEAHEVNLDNYIVKLHNWIFEFK